MNPILAESEKGNEVEEQVEKRLYLEFLSVAVEFL